MDTCKLPHKHALGNLITLAVTLLLSEPSGSERVWLVQDDDDMTGL